MSFEEAKARSRAPITIGDAYTFYSTSVADANVTPYSEQRVEVIAANEVEDPECEPTFRVRAADGHEFDAYEGELNGWYGETGQYVNSPTFGPSEV